MKIIRIKAINVGIRIQVINVLDPFYTSTVNFKSINQTSNSILDLKFNFGFKFENRFFFCLTCRKLLQQAVKTKCMIR